MRSSSKMLVTGAFGGLAAIVVAGSGAFACTATPSVGLLTADGVDTKPLLKPGQTATFRVSGFDPAVVVQDGQGKAVLGADGQVQYIDRKEVVLSWTNPFTGERVELGRGPGPGFVQTFTMPTNLYNSTGNSNTFYTLSAHQVGTNLNQSSFTQITGGQDYPLFGKTGGSDGASTVTGPVAGPQPAQSAGETTSSVNQVAAAAPLNQGSTAGVGAAVISTPSVDQGGSGAAIVPNQAMPAPIPVSAPTPPEDFAPPAGELWSGLKADAAGNLLETVNGTTPPSGGVPAGGIALLGTGILSLAGVAFEATRRRLVLAKATRRR